MPFARTIGLLALALTAACGGSPTPMDRSEAADDQILALVSRGTTSELRWLDPLSLTPIAARRSVEVGLHDYPWAFSPDGRQLVLGSGRRSSLMFVSPHSMRVLGRARTDGFVVALVWPRPDVVLMIENYRQQQLDVVLVDPFEQRVEHSVRIASGAGVLAAARVTDGLALLLGGEHALEPVEVVVVTADGDVRRVRLDAIRGGFVGADRAKDGVARHATPALAVSPDGRRAAVIPAHGVVAIVDLASMSARYHARSRPASLLGRFRDWLEPPARADGGPVRGNQRLARWLRAGIIVSGWDTSPTADGRSQASEPAGLELIDPETWHVRTLAPGPSWFATSESLVLSTGDEVLPALYGSDPDGVVSLVANLPERGSVTVAGGRIYLGLEDQYRPHEVIVFDSDGRKLATPRAPGWVSVLDADRPHICWCYGDP